MKIRGAHIGIALVLCIFGFIVFAVTRDSSRSAQTDEEFLAAVRDKESTAPMELREQATVPPEGVALDSGPQISFPEMEHIHLGTIANDKVGKTEVPITNTGTKPLFIRQIKTSCACTQGEMKNEKNTIGPGETVPLIVSVNPYRVPGFHSDKTLTLLCNDPVNTAHEWHVLADVDPEYHLDTDKIDFGTFKQGTTIEKRVRMRQLYEDIPLKDVRLSWIGQSGKGKPVPGVSYELVEVPEAEWTEAGMEEFELVYRVDSEVATGPLRGLVYLYVDIKRFKAMAILLEGMVEAA